MLYVEVFVADSTYQKEAPLTYSTDSDVEIGQILYVPFRSKKTLAFVRTISRVKPTYTTKFTLANLPFYMSQEQMKLHEWMIEYYPKSSGSITALFLQKNIEKKFVKKDFQAYASKHINNNPEPLTNDQEEVIEQIVDTTKTYILHGETGSGKTRVYAEIAKKVISQQKSVLLLVPEIGLTASIAHEFSKYISCPIYIAHSNQKDSERRALWVKIESTHEPYVIIAPRSGLFLPFKNLGLVVIDEFHDSSYKNEQTPHFSSSRVGAILAKATSSFLILGSATPPVDDYTTALQKNSSVLRLNKPAKIIASKTHISVVDLKNRGLFSRNRFISDELIHEIEASLKLGQQSLLLLNRRGSARVVLCQNCDWQATCPRCETPLTYHGDHHQLICHTCGYKQLAPSQCPICKSNDITFKSIGTKALEAFFKITFPQATIARYDSDTLEEDKIHNNITELKNGSVDILIGTQMLAKGLDLPKLRLVGIVLADSGLFFPDYTAREKTFQLLYQVIGRVGRGHVEGRVVLQTYNPKSSLIQQSTNRSWQEFYDEELPDRKLFHLPPYSYVLKLTIKRKTMLGAENAAHKTSIKIKKNFPQLRYIGPSPAFIEKQAGNYFWQLIITSPKRKLLVDIINSLPSGIYYDIDPSDLL